MIKTVNVTMKYSDYKENFSSNKTVANSYNATNKTIDVITYELTNLDELVQKAVEKASTNEKVIRRLQKVKDGERTLEGTYLDVTRSFINSNGNNGLSFEENEEICQTIGNYKFLDLVIGNLVNTI